MEKQERIAEPSKARLQVCGRAQKKNTNTTRVRSKGQTIGKDVVDKADRQQQNTKRLSGEKN